MLATFLQYKFQVEFPDVLNKNLYAIIGGVCPATQKYVLCDILKHALLMTCMFQPEFTHMTHYSP